MKVWQYKQLWVCGTRLTRNACVCIYTRKWNRKPQRPIGWLGHTDLPRYRTARWRWTHPFKHKSSFLLLPVFTLQWTKKCSGVLSLDMYSSSDAALQANTGSTEAINLHISFFFLKRSSVEFMQKFLSWSGIKHLTVRCPYSSDMCNREDYILPEQNHLYVGYRISEQCGVTLL